MPYINKKYILADIKSMINRQNIYKHKTAILTFILIEIFLYSILSNEYHLNKIVHSFWITYTVLSSIVLLLLISYSMDIDTKRKNKDLNLANHKLKTIIDSQNNMIVITDDKITVEANEKMLDFFGFDSLEEMKEKHECDCISKLFVKHKDYFHLGKMGENQNWIDYLSSLSQKEQVVNLIGCDMEAHAFQVKINKYGTSDRFIITFSNVSDIIIEQRILEYKVQHDKLTDIYNRQKIDEVLLKICKFSMRRKENVGLIMFDIDYFKKINDTYGHDGGDEVLVDIADLIKDKIRDEDIFGRWGGEEFMLILRHSSLKDTFNKAERLRVSLQEYKHKIPTKVTASFGVTALEKNDTPARLLKRVDVALYEAKNSGRNCVIQK